MSKEFNNACIEIERGYAQNTILCIEQMYPILLAQEFLGATVVFLSEKNDIQAMGEIIPSLSVYKNKASAPRSAINVSELWQFIYQSSDVDLPAVRNKSIDRYSEYASECNFAAYSFIKYNALILIKNTAERQIDRRKLNRAARALFFIRQKSQNLINDSNYLADQNREELTSQFTPDLSSAVDTITRFIKKKYSVDAYALQYSEQVKNWSCKQSCPINVGNIVNTYIERVSDEVKPVAGVYENKYFIIFPFISTLVRRDLQSLILIQSDSALPTYIVTNLRYFTNYYFAVYLEEKKSDLLELLQKKTLGLYQDIEILINLGKVIDPYIQLREYIKPAFDIALSATNAFSASLRLYDPESETLEIVYEQGSGRVRESSTLHKSGIPVKEEAKSQVAYVFQNSSPGDDGKNIPDVDKVKRKSHPKYREHRINSRSELCFCVYFKQIAIGVLNFESPQKRGFEHDKKFLKKIRTSLENFITALFESNDKQWLARRARIYQNLHEIKNVINSNYFPREFTEEIQKYIDESPQVLRRVFCLS